MPKFGTRGFLIQKEGVGEDFTIKALADATIRISLRGPDVRDENNQVIKKWVNFTSLSINGEEILDEEVSLINLQTVFISKKSQSLHCKCSNLITNSLN